MENNISPQFIFNIVFALASFFAGWMLRVIFGLMSKIQEDCKDSILEIQSDYRRVSDQVTSLAISMPQHYVSKDDFNQLVKIVHHRFDRLEEKLDAFKKD